MIEFIVVCIFVVITNKCLDNILFIQFFVATLQTPLDIKIITHHFKEILCVVKVIIDSCGTRDDMSKYIYFILKIFV